MGNINQGSGSGGSGGGGVIDDIMRIISMLLPPIMIRREAMSIFIEIFNHVHDIYHHSGMFLIFFWITIDTSTQQGKLIS